MTDHQLLFDTETENKYRWLANVSGVAFKFYIPKQFVPDPPPKHINERIEADTTRATVHATNIRSAVKYVEEKTETVRYAPKGDPETWQIGEPYIPRTVLTQPWPRQLHIAVSWEER